MGYRLGRPLPMCFAEKGWSAGRLVLFIWAGRIRFLVGFCVQAGIPLGRENNS